MKTTKTIENLKKIRKARLYNRIVTTLLNIVPLASAVVLVCVVFYFANSNQDTIKNQNVHYAYDSALKTAKHLEDDFDQASKRVSNLSVTVRDTIENDEISPVLLFNLKKKFSFDAIRFVGVGGYVRSEENGAYIDVTDREYYIEGMKGQGGVSVVYDSRISEGVQIGFYNPVFKYGHILGVIRGVYYADVHLKKILENEYFDEYAPTFLCDKSGMIIAGDMGTVEERYLSSYLIKNNYSNDQINQQIMDAITKGEASSILCDTSLATDNICVIPIEGTDFYLIQAFPSSVSDKMLYEANKTNAFLVAILAILAFINMLLLLARNKRKQRFLEQRNSDMIHVLKGVEYMIKEFIIVDLEKSVFRMTGVDEKTEDDFVVGDYFEISQKILKTIADDGEAARLAYVLDVDNLKEELSRKNGGRYETAYLLGPEAINVSTNAPIGGWCNLVIQALEYDDEGKATLVMFMRGDITSIKEADRAKQDVIDRASVGIEKMRDIRIRAFTGIGKQIITLADNLTAQTYAVLAEVAKEDAIDKSANMLADYSNSIRRIGENIYDLAKIESGEFSLTKIQYKASQLEQDIRSHLLEATQKNGLRFVCEADENCPSVLFGDFDNIERIITNIIDAVVDNSGDGALRCMLSYAIMEADKIALKFVLEDKTYNCRIIESDKIEGYDMRLSISKYLANLMGATMEVTNDDGNIFTFVVIQKIIDM